jgi:catechol 2,3-dioxygenase
VIDLSTQSSTRPTKGASVSHLVLNVRDIEASHHFYTELLGFDQCAELTHTMTMRFYRGNESHHHDFALVQVADPDSAGPPEPWSMEPRRVGVNHIAIGYPDRESWLSELEHLKANGVEFIVRGNHGMTHSAYIADPDGYGIEVLYDLPEEVWSGDVDAALNYFEYLPPEEALEDTTDYQRFGPNEPEPVIEPGRIVVTRESH